MLHGPEFTVVSPTAQTIFQYGALPTNIRQSGEDGATYPPKVNLLDAKFLFASLIWGSVGVGYFVYGKKQEAMIPMIGGLVMIAVSYFVGSWFWMSLTCLVLMASVYWLLRQGY